MKSIKKAKQIISLLLMLIMIVAIPTDNTVTQAKVKSSIAITKKQKQFDKAFRKQFNRYRTSMGLEKLLTDNGLVKAARVRSKQLATFEFSHTMPPKGKDLIELCDSKGAKYHKKYAEIIARIKVLTEVHEPKTLKIISKKCLIAWQASKSHDMAIKGDYKFVGSGYFLNKKESILYVCTIFAN